MKLLTEFDSFILDHAQPIADWIHDLTGFDCISQAKALCGISSCFYLWRLIATQLHQHQFDWFLALGVFFTLQVAFFENSEDRGARSNSNCARNPRRIAPMHVMGRVLNHVLVMMMIWFPIDATTGCVATLWAAWILQACDVQTPRVSRVRKALTFTSAQLVPIPVPR